MPSGCTVKDSITKEKACRKRVHRKGEAVFGISGKKGEFTSEKTDHWNLGKYV